MQNVKVTWIRHIQTLCTLIGSTDLRRFEASQNIGLIRDGSVLFSDESGEILAIGTTEEVTLIAQEYHRVTTIDAHGKTVTPGLIDCHTHLVFGGDRANEFAMRLQGATYGELMAAGGGIYATVNATREASVETLIATAKKRLGKMLSYGVTTVECKSGYGLDDPTEQKQLDVVAQLKKEVPTRLLSTYMGAHAIPKETTSTEYIGHIINNVFPVLKQRKDVDFIDIFCEKGVFSTQETKQLAQKATESGFGFRVHADELSDLGGGKLAAELGAKSADHLLMTSPESVDALAKSNTVAVMLPGTPHFLNMTERAPARALIDAGAAVAVATDYNPGSCNSDSLPWAMHLAALQMKLSPAEILTGVTHHASYSLGLEHQVGQLAVGYQADLVLWDMPSYEHLTYHVGSSLASSVWIAGELVYEAV
jgi:imidazolonepropionase